MTDIEKAKLNPQSVFAAPSEVLSCPDLSRQQKIEILRQWAYDERELEVAEEENMPGTSNGRAHILEEVLRCLIELGADEQDSPPPTKHG